MTVKVIFLDAAGTLIKPVRKVGESYALMAQKYRMDVAPSEISARFHLCFSSAPALAFPGALTRDIPSLERDWWKRLVERIFEPWGRFEGFDDYFSELFAYFAQPGSWALYAEVPETLSVLKQRGISLDVISNFDSRLLRILEGLGASQYLENIFISSRIGHAKPSREIFHAALECHGLSAESALHVGDSAETDFRGAVNAGLKAILLDRDGDDKSEPSLRISNLKELLSVVED
jgi:putative hydrolase of the HAD superfamily